MVYSVGANLQNSLEPGGSGEAHLKGGQLIAGLASAEAPSFFLFSHVSTYLPSHKLELPSSLF